jgi:hypothetical protein
VSKTYKHQRRYIARHWSGSYLLMPFEIERNWCVEIGVGQFRSRANKQHRHLWKQVLQSQDEFKINSAPVKPRNVDWEIW